MKLAPSGLGAEPKKLALLAAILVIGGLVYWNMNRSDAPPAVSANVTPAPVAIPVVKAVPQRGSNSPDPSLAAIQRRGGVGSRSSSGGSGSDNFVPSLKMKDDLDVSTIDPRIRLDLLAKVRAVPLEGGSSSLFEFSKAPEPPAPLVDKIKPGPPAVPVPPPAPATPTPPKVVTPPPPPPPPFKYYGYQGTAADGQMVGLFLEGDPNTGNIYPRREGDTIKDRYKIIRISLRSATVEDRVSNTKSTLPLLEEQQ